MMIWTVKSNETRDEKEYRRQDDFLTCGQSLFDP